MPSDLQARELFHFLFLERLIRATGADLYVLKGGVNLRFFHGSPRYSEDMDLDVRRERVAVQTLRKNGNKILADPAFRRVLAGAGIVDLQPNDPARAKHTETTQRFRLKLVLSSGQTLPTKVEFSGRGVDPDTSLDRIDPEVARTHGRTAYVCEHYGPTAAARQKIQALAGRSRPQTRDLFDLHLLDSRGTVGSTTLEGVEPSVLQAAADAVAAMSEADYQGQVIEFLAPEDRPIHAGRFAEIQERIFILLTSAGAAP